MTFQVKQSTTKPPDKVLKYLIGLSQYTEALDSKPVMALDLNDCKPTHGMHGASNWALLQCRLCQYSCAQAAIPDEIARPIAFEHAETGPAIRCFPSGTVHMSQCFNAKGDFSNATDILLWTVRFKFAEEAEESSCMQHVLPHKTLTCSKTEDIL